jgi:hypothetical protein
MQEDAMSKIISLDDKLKLSAEQRSELARKRKIMAVHKVFQCTHCASKCERCGTGLGQENQATTDDPKIPYHLCDSCAEEYMEYIQRLQGKGDADAYWYNHAWMKIWQTWIEYQGAIDQYLRSKEFRRLLDELRPGGN